MRFISLSFTTWTASGGRLFHRERVYWKGRVRSNRFPLDVSWFLWTPLCWTKRIRKATRAELDLLTSGGP